MGTISDKLMRIINTKEDIRQALISKGYDVPTSIPFKEYAKMILDLPCNADSFPDIEGIVARYSASGLTNEQMAANPVWVDKTGNGHDLQMKNFAWSGMSGVGGYNQNFNQYFVGVDESNKTVSDSSMKLVLLESDSQKVIYDQSSNQIGHTYNFYIKVTGIEGRILNVNAGTLGGIIMSITEDGIYSINVTVSDRWGQNRLYLIFPPSSSSNTITIEQLPLYPGALVFDGVDDYGTCDNFPILTKEKGYTVVALRQWLSFQDIGYPTLVVNSTDRLAAFSFEDFRNETKSTWNWGRSTELSDYKIPLPYTYQTSTSYNSKTIYAGATEEGSNILQVCRSGFYCANAAIWEIVILDHDATEEELTKIKDYFVKTYPWLFPDQAWTVTGKTNEDEDRATIANITGNGNDLVLSNVAFSENSGYGSYPFGMNVWNPDYIADQPYGTVHYPNDSKSYATTVKNNATNFRIKFRLRGLPEGGSFLIRVFDMNDLNTVLKTYTYTENGIHEFVYNNPNKPARIILYNGNTISNISEFYLDIIPEYEGYLVTDGVDDKVKSSIFTMNEDWTIVGDWELLSNVQINRGIVKAQNVYLYNTANGLLISINNPRSLQSSGTKSLHAICSDGRLYDRNWVEYEYTVDQNFEIVESSLNIGFNLNNYTQIAFKNLGIYNNQILSKDDCIKAYNYLQTLKSK